MKTGWTRQTLRIFEKELAEDFKAGKINCPLHLCGGNEDHLISIFKNHIREIDYVLSTHRSHYHYLLKGGSEGSLRAEIYGKPEGMCRGKGRSMHLYDKSINFYTSAIVCGMAAIATGIGMAIKNETKDEKDSEKTRAHVWCFIGDGAEDSGHLCEAARLVASRDLPVTFIIEDNDLSIDSSKSLRWHNYARMDAACIIRYNYKRTYPHVGIGEFINF